MGVTLIAVALAAATLFLSPEKTMTRPTFTGQGSNTASTTSPGATETTLGTGADSDIGDSIVEDVCAAYTPRSICFPTCIIHVCVCVCVCVFVFPCVSAAL